MTRLNITHFGLVAAFLALLCAPAAVMLFHLDPASASLENRRLTTCPNWDLATKDFPTYARNMTGYFSDNFGLRSELIRFNNLSRLVVLRSSPVRGVILGKSPWLFYADENVIEDYENLQPFPEEKLRTLGRILEERRAWLAKRDVKFLVVVAPNKHTVYQEFLPSRIAKVGTQSRLDQLIGELRDHTQVELLDLRAPLLAAKKMLRTYCHTDTHWNDFGGFVGSQEIVVRLRTMFPQIQPLSLDDYEVVTEQQQGGDLAALLSLPDILTEAAVTLKQRQVLLAVSGKRDYANPVDTPKRPMIITETGNASLPRALVFRDSFAWRITPYLSERLQSAVYIWTYDFLSEIIEREHPDVVIMECVERYIYHLGRENPESVKTELAGQKATSGK